MKYLYASWRMGCPVLDKVPRLNIASGPTVFDPILREHISERYSGSYTMLAKPPDKEFMPVGVAFVITPFFGKPVAWAGDFIWFPWASNRNILESTVNFYNQLRREWTVFGFATEEERPFFEHVCRYGVLRRAGKVFDMMDSGVATMFQTRKPKRE